MTPLQIINGVLQGKRDGCTDNEIRSIWNPVLENLLAGHIDFTEFGETHNKIQAKIIEETCSRYKLTLQTLKGRERFRDHVWCRDSIAVLLAKHLPSLTQNIIGSIIGIHRTSVITANFRHGNKMRFGVERTYIQNFKELDSTISMFIFKLNQLKQTL